MLDCTEDVAQCANDSINFNDVLARVALRRKESMDYLVRALNS